MRWSVKFQNLLYRKNGAHTHTHLKPAKSQNYTEWLRRYKVQPCGADLLNSLRACSQTVRALMICTFRVLTPANATDLVAQDSKCK